MQFQDKIAFVTGAASGMGLATARRLAEQGATVYGADLSGEALAQEFARLPHAHPVPLDIADADAVRAAFAEIEARQDRLDVLVNAAGVNAPDQAALEELNTANYEGFLAAQRGESYHPEFFEKISDEDFDRTMRINLYGSFHTIRSAVPLLKKTGGGAIVNFSSAAALMSVAMPAYYPASKAAILGLTREAATELAPFNIRVNALAPGAVDTPLFRQNDPEFSEFLVGMQPIKRPATPEEVASTVTFLAGDEGAYYTGQTFSPSGGLVMQ
ncbi:SDR family NAD(P)-dependent oxidoreductase [Haloactinomyces albus]|uniref:3-oxoacyl-[acyl-carrier protein] reductase n=1 Tax=Haloactinomyces albus TaxID=1352928 RepID=A0AAE4CQB6_9ACTN|nr:SDR family oxidoreductase [Haloactinomyces albus]MDR7303987.1 3-oxoacyl-[acyl-carrier protein] reductase [Haloactinomyces albus]